MSSDADYATFLDKANQSTSDSKVSAQSANKPKKTKAVDTEVPEALQSVQEYYVSDADEPFEPVSLKWSGTELPSADEFGKLIGHDATKISQKDFDAQGQYTKVVDAVNKAGSGDAGYFRVELAGTRTEYFVVIVDTEHKRLVGLKVLAVES